LHELHDRVALRADRFHAGPVRLGLCIKSIFCAKERSSILHLVFKAYERWIYSQP
jgi:hypothetical protein